jgi:hypothetical protein
MKETEKVRQTDGKNKEIDYQTDIEKEKGERKIDRD